MPVLSPERYGLGATRQDLERGSEGGVIERFTDECYCVARQISPTSQCHALRLKAHSFIFKLNICTHLCLFQVSELIAERDALTVHNTALERRVKRGAAKAVLSRDLLTSVAA